MQGFGILLRKELLEQWRTRRLVVVAVIFLLLGLQAPLSVYFTRDLIAALAPEMNLQLPPPTQAQALAELQETLGMASIAAILLAMGAVARDKERGTAALVLTRPVGRLAFLLAKCAGLAATFAVAAALASMGGYYYLQVLFTAPPAGGYIASCALALLSCLVYAALTLLASTLVRSSLPAAGLGLGALLVLSVLGALPRIGTWMPGALMAAGVALAQGQDPQALGSGITGSLLLVVVPLVAAWVVFRRQELPS